MKIQQAAYIAGIIDGEGSISLVKQSRNQYHSPLISIASADLELLQWVQNATGFGTIIKKKNYNPDKHKDSYAINIRYNQAISLLKEIVEFLVITRKKKRAQLILNEYKKVTPRNGRYNKELLDKKTVFYRNFMSI